jgi:hypothetical protein
MRTPIKLVLLVLGLVTMISCNNNKGKGNDTTEAGTEQYDDVNDPMESRTPSSSLTTDSTGATSPAVENPAMGSDTTTTTGIPEPRVKDRK